MMDIKIVPMTGEHISAVADLEKLCFPDPWSEHSIASELDNPLSLWLVALCGSDLAGYIGSQSAAGESDMMNVAVAPAFRRCGIGERLVSALEQRLREKGDTALFLEVRVSNLPAISLYEKLGFQTVGIRKNYYFHPREDARIMRKELVNHEDTGC